MKKYIFEATDDGKSVTFNSKNEGFTGLEVLGMLTSKQYDILEQLRGIKAPNIITRNVIVEQDDQ